MDNLIKLLQKWYVSQCDEDWEHSYGILIETLDNPGWHLRIDCSETDLEGKFFNPIFIENSEHDWIHCKVSNSVFEAATGPENLEQALMIFLDWAKNAA